MNIRIRHLDRTCLDELAYRKLIERYSLQLQYDILIVFDMRIKNYYGDYEFNSDKKIHNIAISLNRCKYEDEVRVDEGGEKYNLISTTIHELYHAKQYEKLGSKLFCKPCKDIKNKELASLYSDCEIEARVFENKNLLEAVQYYDACVKR